MDAMIIMAKQNTLPMPSATQSASSLPPFFRAAERVSSRMKTAKNATTISRASASSQAVRTIPVAASCR